MSKTTIDVSIAAELDIINVGSNERVVMTFTADENWPSGMKLTVWNSYQKNREITVPNNALTVLNTVMTWTIDPTAQEIAADEYYYEIFNPDNKRIYFKSKIQINK